MISRRNVPESTKCRLPLTLFWVDHRPLCQAHQHLVLLALVVVCEYYFKVSVVIQDGYCEWTLLTIITTTINAVGEEECREHYEIAAVKDDDDWSIRDRWRWFRTRESSASTLVFVLAMFGAESRSRANCSVPTVPASIYHRFYRRHLFTCLLFDVLGTLSFRCLIVFLIALKHMFWHISSLLLLK